jgi:hypothetical protein
MNLMDANAQWRNRPSDERCETLWQLVQGFTAAARTIEHIDTRVDLETRAGRLLDLVR